MSIEKPLGMAVWIQRELTRYLEDNDESYKVDSFVLVHMKGASEAEEVQTLKLGSKEYLGKELSKRFDELANTFASGLIGRQQFRLKSIYVNGDSGIYNFGKAGEITDVDWGTEGPSEKGHVSQMMRHNEALMRIMTISIDQQLQRTNEMLGTMQTHCKNLMEENVQAFSVIKEITIEQAKQEHNDQASLLEYQRKTKEREHLMTMLPALINKWVGKEVIPETGVANMVLNHLKESLTPTQLEQIMGILTPEQAAPLLHMLTQEQDSNNESNSK